MEVRQLYPNLYAISQRVRKILYEFADPVDRAWIRTVVRAVIIELRGRPLHISGAAKFCDC
jgi:hypothetical protein